MKPHRFYAVRIDESDAICDERLLAICGGKIFTVYLYDDGEQTHLCEFTPSFWLEEMENIPNIDSDKFYEDYDALCDDDRDEIEESLREIRNYDGGIYVHCREIESIPCMSSERFGCFASYKERTASCRVELGEFESMDEAREAYQGNPIW